MINVNLVLMVAAFVFLLLAAFQVTSPRINFGWLGLSLWVLALLLH